jgi:hypothetical protein
MLKRNLILVVAILIAVMLALATSFILLPAAPVAPTPTYPLGIDLPNQLHRITQP